MLHEPRDKPRPRALSGAYVDRVRFAWERALPKLPAGAFGSERPMVPGQTPDLVALTEASAPRVLRVAREVAETLGFAEELVVWQTRSFRQLNAQAMLPLRPFAIRLIGPVAKLLSDAALRAMMGHELGHALAHRELLAMGSTPLAWSLTPPPRGLVESWTLAMELTADRFALLACQDLEAAVHLELASSAGDDPAAQGVVAADYLRECVTRLEQGRAPLLHSLGPHPSIELRLYASWLFSRTDVYRELVGEGTGELRLASVDEALVAICDKAMKPLLESAPPAPMGAPVRPEVERAKPKPAAVDAADVILTFAWAAGEAAGRMAARAGGALRSTAAEVRPTASANPRSVDEDEEVEAQLARLEREVAAERAGVDADLERQFRELEARERRKKG